MNILIFKTLFTCNETGPYGFEGETFFTSGKAVDLKTGTEKWVIYNTEFNGLCLGAGFTTIVVSEEELKNNFTVKSETFEEMERRVYDKYHNSPNEEIEKNKPSEPLFSEEEIENIRKDFASFKTKADLEVEPEVEIRIWQTKFTPKEDNSILKMGQTYLISTFAKTSDSEELGYVLAEVATVNVRNFSNSYEPIGHVVYISNKEELLKKFTIVNG